MASASADSPTQTSVLGLTGVDLGKISTSSKTHEPKAHARSPSEISPAIASPLDSAPLHKRLRADAVVFQPRSQAGQTAPTQPAISTAVPALHSVQPSRLSILSPADMIWDAAEDPRPLVTPLRPQAKPFTSFSIGSVTPTRSRQTSGLSQTLNRHLRANATPFRPRNGQDQSVSQSSFSHLLGDIGYGGAFTFVHAIDSGAKAHSHPLNAESKPFAPQQGVAEGGSVSDVREAGSSNESLHPLTAITRCGSSTPDPIISFSPPHSMSTHLEYVPRSAEYQRICSPPTPSPHRSRHRSFPSQLSDPGLSRPTSTRRYTVPTRSERTLQSTMHKHLTSSPSTTPAVEMQIEAVELAQEVPSMGVEGRSTAQEALNPSAIQVPPLNYALMGKLQKDLCDMVEELKKARLTPMPVQEEKIEKASPHGPSVEPCLSSWQSDIRDRLDRLIDAIHQSRDDLQESIRSSHKSQTKFSQIIENRISDVSTTVTARSVLEDEHRASIMGIFSELKHCQAQMQNRVEELAIQVDGNDKHVQDPKYYADMHEKTLEKLQQLLDEKDSLTKHQREQDEKIGLLTREAQDAKAKITQLEEEQLRMETVLHLKEMTTTGLEQRLEDRDTSIRDLQNQVSRRMADVRFASHLSGLVLIVQITPRIAHTEGILALEDYIAASSSIQAQDIATQHQQVTEKINESRAEIVAAIGQADQSSAVASVTDEIMELKGLVRVMSIHRVCMLNASGITLSEKSRRQGGTARIGWKRSPRHA